MTTWAALRTWGVALLLALALALGAGVGLPAQAQGPAGLDDGARAPAARFELPAGVTLLPDRAYGTAARHRLDVYLPPAALRPGAPLVLMVHGGGWAQGDKALASVVRHKVGRWVPRGVVFVSMNYRLLPEAAPLQQAQDVAQALAWVQTEAVRWQADASQVVLMGHSAGAHLAALVSASAPMRDSARVQPWAGTVLLDSAALDVPRLMSERHWTLFDTAFGSEPTAWRAASPWHQLSGALPPVLLVCSSRRERVCADGQDWLAQAAARGTRTRLLPQALSHRDINDDLGQPDRRRSTAPSAYTLAVEDFLRTLGPALDQRLRD
jgi:arylformamidase